MAKKRKGGRQHHAMSWKRVKRLRAKLALKQGWLCYWCQTPMTRSIIGNPCAPTQVTLEHIVALADGGTNDPRNLVAACAACNNSRPSATLLAHNQQQSADARR